MRLCIKLNFLFAVLEIVLLVGPEVESWLSLGDIAGGNKRGRGGIRHSPM